MGCAEKVRPNHHLFRRYPVTLSGFEVTEVPIHFHDRRVGESKMSKRIVAEAAWRVPLMRLRGWPPKR
jgi:dolichol-phosphate mannosyltransferase